MGVVPTEVATYDIVIRQGTTFRRLFTWRNPNDPVTGDPGVPIDLSGYYGKWYIEHVDQGDLVLGGESGTIDMTIIPARTAAMSFDAQNWFLRLTDPEGNVIDMVQGSCRLEKVSAE